MEKIREERISLLQHLEDDELMAMVRQEDDMDAFDALHRRYCKAMLNYAYRLLGDYGKAEDVTQQVFLQVYRYAPYYRPSGRFKGYIYRIANNLVKKEVRRRERRLQPVSMQTPIGLDEEKKTELGDIIPNGRYRPDKKAMEREYRSKLLKAIRKIPLKFRQVFVLCAVDGLSYKEAADRLDCRPGTVSSRLVRARRIFDREMGITKPEVRVKLILLLL